MIEGASQALNVEAEYDIVAARKAVRAAAVDLGFGVTDVTRIVTAASELARNIFLYAGSGAVAWRAIEGERRGIELIFADRGPGIANVEECMQPGFTTGKGMGMGLPGAKRLMDEMEVHTALGEGTTVIIRKWLRD